jgi:hypothetical protein
LTDITRQQHQLHRGYARAYSETNKDTELVYYDVEGNKLSLQSTRSLSAETDLYETRDTNQNQIEKWFSTKERLWTDSLKAASRDELLTTEDYCNLAEFAFLTALRQKELIAVYHNFYECFGEQNGRDAFIQSFGSISDYMRNEWLDQDPHMRIVSIEEIASSRFYLTSDNPVIFFDENKRHQPLWTVPLRTYHGFFFPVSSTRLFVSYLGNEMPELVSENNLLQRIQAREAVFTDKSKEEFMSLVCRVSMLIPVLGIDLYQINQNLVMNSGVKLPIRGIIVSAGKEIHIIPDSGPQSGKRFLVYPA